MEKDDTNIFNLKAIKTEKSVRAEAVLKKTIDKMARSTDKMEKYFNFKATHREIYFKSLLKSDFTREEALRILLNEDK